MVTSATLSPLKSAITKVSPFRVITCSEPPPPSKAPVAANLKRLIACAVGIRVNQTEVYLVDAVLIIFDLIQNRKCHTIFSGIFALKHVCTQPTEHGIRPLPTPKRIFAVTPQKRVISQTADEAIFIAIAQKFIIARLAPLSVTLCTIKEMVIAIATIKRVVALITCQVIIAAIAI